MAHPLGRRFVVEVSPRAIDDLHRVLEFIALDSPANAARMRGRLEKAIDGLAYMPSRHPHAPERRSTGGELRHALVRPFRVVYEVGPKRVYVHMIRHGAMRPAEDL